MYYGDLIVDLCRTFAWPLAIVAIAYLLSQRKGA